MSTKSSYMYDDLLASLTNVKRVGAGHSADCPKCGACMQIGFDTDDEFRLVCSSGCPRRDILAVLSWREKDLPRRNGPGKPSTNGQPQIEIAANRVGRFGKYRIIARSGAEVIHTDEIPLGDSFRREKCAQKIAAKSNGNLSAKDALTKLDALDAETIAQPEPSAEGKKRPQKRNRKQSCESETVPDASEELNDFEENRVPIEVTPDEHLVNPAALGALLADPDLFQRGGVLVHVVRNDESDSRGIRRPENAPRIATLSPASLREKLAARCWFFTRRQKGDTEELVQEHPPSWTVSAIHQRGHWPQIRELRGIVTCPILRADGSLLVEPGYDQASGLWYLPGGDIPVIPMNPTRDDAISARDNVLDIVVDFLFARECHRAAWLAALLTPLARQMFCGPAPLFLVEANVPAAGKGLLIQLISEIVNGRGMSVMSNPRNDDEARKRITALVMGGDAMVLIDNVVGALGSQSLDAALTGTVWKDRILGVSQMVELPLQMVWYATANNVALALDTARRCCHVRLDCPYEQPEEREGFKYPALIEHVRDNRNQLLAAALTMLRAWVVAEMPDMGLKPWGSFESWSSVVRNAIVWCGLPDPADGRTELRSRADREGSALRGLLAGLSELLRDGGSMTAHEIIRTLEQSSNEFVQLRDSVLDLCGTSGSKLPSAGSLGNKLRYLRRRVVGGRMLDGSPDRNGVARWQVIDAAGPAGSAGSDCRPVATAPAPFSTSDDWEQTRQVPQTPHADYRSGSL